MRYDRPMHDTASALFEYMRRADGRILDVCETLTPEQYAKVLGGSFPSVQATVAHVAAAADVWSTRLEGGTPTRVPDVSDYGSLQAARDRLDRAHRVFIDAAEHWSGPEAEEVFTYVNTQGATVTLPRWAVLRHIVNHATYHRGQLTNMLRILGVTVPATDISVWAKR
jgi:uncharacterized damage-inducible protein DinB